MEYSVIKQKQCAFLNDFLPNKVMSLGSLTNCGENVFNYAGKSFPANPSFAAKFDKLIGVGAKQEKIVKNASGDVGLRNFKNYINMARGMSEAKDVLVIASPTEKKLVNIIPLVKDYITPQIFFDFADVLAEETHSHFEKIETENNDSPLVRLYFNRNDSDIVSFGRDEEFITNGFYLEWTPASVEMGHYYTRLICTNGQTEVVNSKDAAYFSLESKDIKRMIDFVNNGNLSRGTVSLETKIRNTINSRISLNEMYRMQSVLLKANVDEALAETLIPYQTTSDMYKQAGYGHINPQKLKGKGTIWDSYNVLTDFASHTDTMADDDSRRGRIMSEAFNLLNKTPDIIENEYVDIF